MRRKTWRPASRRRVGFINFQAGVSNWLPNILFMNRVDFQGRGRGSGRGRERRNPPLSPLITLVKFHLRSREPGRGFLFLPFLFLKTSIPRMGSLPRNSGNFSKSTRFTNRYENLRSRTRVTLFNFRTRVDGVLLLEFVDELLRRRRRRHSWRGDA